jgi:DNA-binding response OmpR family regulator
LTKPVNFEELVWRIDALLRRSKIVNEGKIQIGEVILNEQTYTVTRGKECIELPTKEFKLLYLLLSYPNKIFTKEKILDRVWGYSSESDETTVRTHINRLRSKFEHFPEFDIVTIRGLGYKAVINK